MKVPVPRAVLKVAPCGRPDAVNVTVLDRSESVTFTLNLMVEPATTLSVLGIRIIGAGVTVILKLI